jgi:hypothetical protein
MSYSVIYSNEFDSLDNLLTLRLQIEKKDFTGSPIDIILSGNPIIQEWQEDDQKAPIRGCTLKVNIITDSSGIALTDFYSDDDNTFKAILKRAQTDEVLFVGYLLQDDCAELYVDFNHEISLTFTDNLGILKDTTLDIAAETYTIPTDYIGVEMYSYTDIFYGNRIWVKLPEGNYNISSFIISNSIYLNGTYTVTLVSIENGFIVFTVNETVPISTSQTGDFFCDKSVDLVNYFSLAQILRLCLRSTDLDLATTVATSLYPVGGTTQELVLDTYLSINTFQKANEWMTCYDILEIIMSRFNASLFQAHGRWFIVRFDEIYRYFGQYFPIYTVNVYNYDFVPGGTSPNITPLSFGTNDAEETGVIKSLVRPYQYVKETFNYVQPQSLMKNNNLQELGPLISEYNSGTNHIKEYDLLYWIPWVDHPSPTVTKLIRVVIDNDITSDNYGTEIDRYIVIKGEPYDRTRAIMYEGVELSEGDVLEWSFDYKTENSEPGVVTSVFEIALQDGIIPTKWISTDGNWITTYSGTPYGIVFQILNGDNANEWHTVRVRSKLLPYNAIVFPFLTSASSDNTNYETHYKNLSFNVFNYINGTIKIIGQTHEDYQLNNLKNNIDREIFIDNSPRTSINGALMLESYIGYIRNRCSTWKYQSGADVYITLGGVATAEALWTNYKTRIKFELTLRKLYYNEKILTPFSCFTDSYLYGTSKYFIPGKMTIDYKSGSCNMTIREIIDNIDGISSPQIDEFIAFFAARFYEFNYIHEKS